LLAIDARVCSDALFAMLPLSIPPCELDWIMSCVLRLPVDSPHEQRDAAVPPVICFPGFLLLAFCIVLLSAARPHRLLYGNDEAGILVSQFPISTRPGHLTPSTTKPVFGMDQTQTHSSLLIVLTMGSDRSRSTLYKKVVMESWAWGFGFCIDHSHTRSRARAFALFPGS
jgi:hypothetical protein